jgi:hypothetical protein
MMTIYRPTKQNFEMIVVNYTIADALETLVMADAPNGAITLKLADPTDTNVEVR